MLLFGCLMLVFLLWYWSESTISVNTVSTPRVEAFCWAAITFSQTLGTALGDWLADTGGPGYEGGALVFTVAIIAVAGLYYWTDVSRVLLFWAAFILTRPLGATVGDFLDKPLSQGGLALSRPIASVAIAVFIVVCIILLPQRAARHPAHAEAKPLRRKLMDGSKKAGQWMVGHDEGARTGAAPSSQFVNEGQEREERQREQCRRRVSIVDRGTLPGSRSEHTAGSCVAVWISSEHELLRAACSVRTHLNGFVGARFARTRHFDSVELKL